MAAAPAAAGAQSRVNLSLAPTLAEPPLTPQTQGRAPTMPMIDYVAPDGRVERRRGVLLGLDVAPNASFGLGIFEGAPKRRFGAPDPALPERRSKRAAIGFSAKF